MNVTYTPWPHIPQAYFILGVVVRSSLGLSTLGSLLIILFMAVTKKYRIFVQKLVLAVAINTFFYGSVNLWTSFYEMTDSSTGCKVHSFCMQYFGLTLLLWIFVITIYLFMRVYNFGSFLSRYFFSVVCPLVLLPPLAPTIYLFLGGYYGPAGVWCWITKEHQALRLGTFYIPFFISVGIEILLYVLITVKVYKMTKPQARDTNLNNQNNLRYRDEVKPLIFFPIIYMCMLLPIAVIRVNEALDSYHKPSFALAILSAICDKTNGFVNSIVYLVFLTDRKELSFTNLYRLARKTFCCQPDEVEHGVEVFSRTMAYTNTQVHDS